MKRELEWFTMNIQSWIMPHNICFCRKEVMLQIFHGFFSCESHLYSDCSCFTRNPWAVLELQLHFSWSYDKSSSYISTSTNLQPQSKGVKFHWTTVMNIFIHVVKLGHLKTSMCVISLVFVAVCGDDMVGCVPQLVAHEAPREGVWLWIGLHVNTQEQTLAWTDLDGSVVHRCWIDESFPWKIRKLDIFFYRICKSKIVY